MSRKRGRPRKKTINFGSTIDVEQVDDILDTGCLVCGKDDDHAHLLLCESCNGEYHTYCLQPKLDTVPTIAWYCAKCSSKDDHVLEAEIMALDTSYRNRFGEICWAQGGVGYGWWPVCIYSPLWTQGPARTEAKRQLGKRYLVYYFQCHESPFAVLPPSKLLDWISGLAESMYLGRTAKAFAVDRYQMFQRAFQEASLQYDEPLAKRRADHNRRPTTLVTSSNGPYTTTMNTGTGSPRRRENSTTFPFTQTGREKALVLVRRCAQRTNVAPSRALSNISRVRILPPKEGGDGGKTASPSKGPPQSVSILTTSNGRVLDPTKSHGINAEISAAEEAELVCTIWCQQESFERQLGFVILPSMSSTFVDVRDVITQQIDSLSGDWNFFIPNLGPLSRSQESMFGAMVPFFSRRLFTDKDVGHGSPEKPLRLFIVKTASP